MVDMPDRESVIINLSNNIIEGYLRLHQPLERSDVIIGLGSSVKLTAVRSVELYQRRLGSKILFTGYHPQDKKDKELDKDKTKYVPESWNFCIAALEQNVPVQDIIVEEKATNTPENAIISRQKLESLGIYPQSALIVCVPYHERRALATFQKQWPKTNFRVTSPEIDVRSYLEETGIRPDIIGRRVINEIKNIQKYSEKNDIVSQPLPWDLRNTYNALRGLVLFNENLTSRHISPGYISSEEIAYIQLKLAHEMLGLGDVGPLHLSDNSFDSPAWKRPNT